VCSSDLYSFITAKGNINIHLSLPVRHNVMNALAAAAVALVLDISAENIASALQAFSGVSGRLNIQAGLNGAGFVGGTFNANPLSLNAAIDVLTEMEGETFLVLGDMAELGTTSEALHFESGQHARRCGVSRLYALGDLSRNAVKGFGEGAKFFDSREELIDALTKSINESTTVTS